MKSDNSVLNFTLVVAGLLFVLSVFFYSNQGASQWLTGFVTDTNDTAVVNVTVEETIAINFTRDTLDFGSGRIFTGASNATLDSGRTGAAIATNVTGGNFSGNTGGLTLENIGNANLTLWLKTNRTAFDFLGGTTPAPEYQFNVTNNETGSCLATSGFTLGALFNMNATNSSLDGTRICDKFFFEGTRDVVRIDIRIVIPSDSRTGLLQDTIVAGAYKNSTN